MIISEPESLPVLTLSFADIFLNFLKQLLDCSRLDNEFYAAICIFLPAIEYGVVFVSFCHCIQTIHQCRQIVSCQICNLLDSFFVKFFHTVCQFCGAVCQFRGSFFQLNAALCQFLGSGLQLCGTVCQFLDTCT